MSKETRTIRPFTGLGELAGVFDSSVLRFGSDICLPNDSVVVDLTPQEFLGRSVQIEWTSDASEFERFRQRVASCTLSAGFGFADLELVVIASSAFLKLADRVFTSPVSDLAELSRVADLSQTDASSFRTPFSGFAVDAYLVLSQDLEPKPLRPHQSGTWLAHTKFRVETSQGPALLPPTALSDEIRQKLGLPAKTIRYLDFQGHDILEPYGEQEQPVFYVDEKLLAQMSARRNSPASKALQLQLALDFVVAVVGRASRLPDVADNGYADLRSSLVGSIARVAAGPGAPDQELDRIIGELRERPERVIARAEHFIDLAAGYAGVLEDVNE